MVAFGCRVYFLAPLLLVDQLPLLEKATAKLLVKVLGIIIKKKVKNGRN